MLVNNECVFFFHVFEKINGCGETFKLGPPYNAPNWEHEEEGCLIKFIVTGNDFNLKNVHGTG